MIGPLTWPVMFSSQQAWTTRRPSSSSHIGSVRNQLRYESNSGAGTCRMVSACWFEFCSLWGLRWHPGTRIGGWLFSNRGDVTAVVVPPTVGLRRWFCVLHEASDSRNPRRRWWTWPVLVQVLPRAAAGVVTVHH